MRQIRFELFMAREEFEMTRERMTGAKYTYAAQGKWIYGLAPYGYQLNKKTSKLDPVEEEAKVVELIFDLFLNGLIGTVKYKVKEKEKDGKRTIRPENEQIIVPDAHTPIIDKVQFEEANKKIENKIPLLPNRSDYKLNELAGVCICADCGGPLSKYEAKRKRQNKNGTESLYHVKVLRCLNNKCMNVRYNDVEEAILDYFRLFQSLNDKQLTNHIENMVHSHENKNNIQSQKQINEQFEQREKELQNKLNFIFDK